MNEFKWSKEYSRSIGTDVWYILLLVGKYDGATARSGSWMRWSSSRETRESFGP